MKITKAVRCETPMLEGLALTSKSVKVDEKTGDLTFTAIALDTKKTPNRKGFVFKWNSPSDVNIESLQANGRLYFMHETYRIAVGFIESVKVTRTQVLIKGMIPGDSRFSEEMQESDLVKQIRTVREAVATGLLKAVSIGFFIQAYEEQKDPKTGRTTSLKITKLEIIETSIVTIGAHETALIQSIGGVTNEDDLQWAEEALEEELAPKDGFKQFEISEKQYARVGEFVSMGIDTTTEDYAPDELDSEQVLAMIAADAEQDAEVRDWSEVATEMGKLLGARGGLKLTPEEREEQYVALAKDYVAHEKKPPELKDYTAEELKALHEDGVIQIAGAKKAGEVIVKLEAGDFNESLKALLGICERIEVAVEKIERFDSKEKKQAAPEPAPLVDLPLDEEALRQTIREALNDPSVRALSKLNAEAYVAQKREENRERIRNGRRK